MGRLFSLFTSLLTTLTQFISTNSVPPPVAAQTDSSLEWRQYQHDENRSGYNPDTNVSATFNQKWFHEFSGDAISYKTQPVMSANRVFVGTKKGFAYAFAIDTGQLLWQSQLSGPVVQTSAVSDASVFFATLTGDIYALSLTSGTPLWQVHKDDSFGSALLLVESQNMLVLTGRWGNVFALNTQNGNQIWEKNVNYMITAAPTYGNNRIYVAAEDLRMRALDSATGNIIWTSSQLYGRSFDGYAPVYADEKIFIHTIAESYTRINRPDDTSLLRETSLVYNQAYGFIAGSSEVLNYTQTKTQEWLTAHPDGQTFYALDATSGQPSYRPGILMAVVNNGAQAPPIVIGQSLYSTFHFTSPRWKRLKWADGRSLPFNDDAGAMGKLDLATGRLIYSFDNPYQTPSELTIDEGNNYSAAGGTIFGARCTSLPGCMNINGSSCRVITTVVFHFTADLCEGAGAPAFTADRLAYQTWNTLIVYGP